MKPTSKRLITGLSAPPMKPILLVFVVRPATTPTKKEPSFSAKVMDSTLGASTTLSIIANLPSGLAVATSLSASPKSKPIAQVSA
ncbi:hypothetical protein D3C77_432070 [compost metagenome]